MSCRVSLVCMRAASTCRAPGIPCMLSGQARMVRLVARLYATLARVKHSLCLPGDFHNIGPKACENCKRLVEVNLMCTEITVILSSTFAHCVVLTDIWLPLRLQRIGKEDFLRCISLCELVTPTEVHIEMMLSADVNSWCDSHPSTGERLKEPSKQTTMPF